MSPGLLSHTSYYGPWEKPWVQLDAVIVTAVPKRIPGNESNEVSVVYCPQKHESRLLKGKITGKKEGGREENKRRTIKSSHLAAEVIAIEINIGSLKS